MANIILHPWRLASEPMPIELYGMPLLIEDFLGNYVVGHYAGLWWADMYDDAEVRIFPDWVNDFDYLPVESTGYMKEFNMIIIKPKYGC